MSQDFSKYLNVSVDSKDLKNMSKEGIKKLIKSSKNQNGNNGNNGGKQESDYKNASGTYITTSDGKHYLVLPDIMTNNDITNNTIQATNGGNLLIEQTTLTKGALNNYGKILLDTGFVSGDKPKLSITGNLNNYNTIDMGANGSIAITGEFSNKGQLIFRIQSDPNNNNQEVKNAQMTISGKTTFDISPGSSGAFKADIVDIKTLTNLGSNTNKQYDLIKVQNGGSINYTYTQGNYTTTFSKSSGNGGNGGSTSIKTESSNGSCNGNGGSGGNCTVTVNNKTQQKTEFTDKGKDNPWMMDKAQVDSNGNVVENNIGSTDNKTAKNPKSTAVT